MIYILSLLMSFANADPIKVAVLDSGFNFKYSNQISLCKSGHKDFTNSTLMDYNGHGTNVAGLIDKNVKNKSGYCIVVMKVFSTNNNNQLSFIKALKYLQTTKINVINYSGGGSEYSKMEKILIKKLLDRGKIIVAAAGNEGKDLATHPYYPAILDKRIVVVGNMAKSSNYGYAVDIILDGNNKKALGYAMSGSSQSTAIVTGLIVRRILDVNKRNDIINSNNNNRNTSTRSNRK